MEEDKLILIAGWARDGLTDEQIAHNMGIAYSTFREWKDKYSAISAVLKKSKEVADRIVENALYERALGGTHQVRKTFKVKKVWYDEYGRRNEQEELKTGIDEVYVPGDTTAQIFWLKNRKPQEWRDKRDVEQKVEFETDGFMEALKGDVKSTFEKAGDIVET